MEIWTVKQIEADADALVESRVGDWRSNLTLKGMVFPLLMVSTAARPRVCLDEWSGMCP